MREELLFDSERTRISRVRESASPGTLLRKDFLGGDSARRARQESTVLSLLAGIPGIPALVGESQERESILLEDVSGTTLATVLDDGPLDESVALPIAAELAGILAEIHTRGIIHRDLNPNNILLHGTPQKIILFDFDLALVKGPNDVLLSPANQAIGTLPYLAPEQTGRTGWGIDQRTDLYALGATIYEMVTGKAPFDGDDPLNLTSDHLARIPTAPDALVPAVSPLLSAIVMRLLEKEPGRRYQSAHGVRHDLRRLIDSREQSGGSFRLGERDFPDLLVSPAHLVGRENETRTLSEAFAAVASGAHRTVVVSGEPGVGKTTLVNTLRPLVAATRGWFLAGKFQEYAEGLTASAPHQVIGSLAQMLLALPEAELEATRTALRDRLGGNAGLLVSLEPQLGPVIGTPAETTSEDPSQVRQRLQRATVDLLATVARPDRPVVVFLDDVQWADPASVALIESLGSSRPPQHVLLVYAYRESELSPGHPLWDHLSSEGRHAHAMAFTHLDNLDSNGVRALLGELLRLPPDEVGTLADHVVTSTRGNPFHTIELVNSLRADQLLVLGDQGWSWDPQGLARRSATRADEMLRRLAVRVSEQPEESQRLLQTVLCLGGSADLSLVRALSTDNGLPRALADGLLAMDFGHSPSVRFAHDWIAQAVHNGMSERARRAQALALARQLADQPEHVVLAANQYLAALADVDDPQERRSVVQLLRASANQAAIATNFDLVHRYLTSAAELMEGSSSPPDLELRLDIDLARHNALYALGRNAEVDKVYQAIQRYPASPWLLARAAWAQISSLTNRGDLEAALALGRTVLADLGSPIPSAADLASAVESGLDDIVAWAATDPADEPAPSVPPDPQVMILGRILGRLAMAAYFLKSPVSQWLTIEAFRLWTTRGPHPALVGPLVPVGTILIARRQDYRSGRDVVARVLHTAERLGFPTAVGQARQVYASSAGPWFEPLERTVRQAHQAKEDLLREGDTQYASFAYFTIAVQSLDSRPTLGSALSEVTSGMALAARTSNALVTMSLLAFRQAIRTLRGDTVSPESPEDEDFAEAEHLATVSANPTAETFYHLTRALVGLLLDQEDIAHQHTVALLPLLNSINGTYGTAVAQLLMIMDLAHRLRAGTVPQPDRQRTVDQVKAGVDWFGERARAAPENFMSLYHLVEAEAAWVRGDIPHALRTFDRAQREVTSRPWHRALIAERLARCQLDNGIEYGGRISLREARNAYHEWGAKAKVQQLEQEYPFLAEPPEAHPEAPERSRTISSWPSVTAETVDMLAVLRASQALSSETSLIRLRERIAEVLRALTGATGVQVVTWMEEAGDWFLLPPAGKHELPLASAAAQGLVPLSAFRYVERTGEPLLVEDATRDDRFFRDDYLAGLDACSLMVVPIRTRGRPRVMLLLENRHGRAAFNTHRLDAVLLLAGQLSVSLDNALLYADLENKVAARTIALKTVNDRLEQLAITDPLTGLANRRRLTDVLADEWDTALRRGTPVGMAMVDIDYFKQYNDHYGHLAGDTCLRKIASAIDRSVRESDLLARYGGEEFAIVLPGAGSSATWVIGERIRQAVIELAEPHIRSPNRIVTISVGVASMVPSAGHETEEIIKAADAELYRAKGHGRNSVSASSSLTVPSPSGRY